MGNLTPNARKVLERRYLARDEKGNVMEKPEDLFRRVAHSVAKAEHKYINLPADSVKTGNDIVKEVEDEFFEMMNNLEFLPNSPTLMNAGRALGQLSACFVLPVKNTVEEILETIKNTALIHKSGGGTGFNFSEVKLPAVLPQTYRPIFVLSAEHKDANLLKETKFSHAETLVCTESFINAYKEHDKILVIEDNMENIFDTSKLLRMPEVIIFSKVRPAKSRVQSTSGEASGPVSFMKVWNEAVKFLTNNITPITAIKLSNMCTEVVKQGGTRRGANMGIVNIDCEYILDFITCKQDNNEITNFNISVGIVGDFWDSLEKDMKYDVRDYSTGQVVMQLDAREVMNKIVDNAWNNGEPGIIFLDKVNEGNPVVGILISSTNPCGEQPLLPYEACNLGSINLVEMLKFEHGIYEVDEDKIKRTVRKAVKFLDDVIDVNNYPIPEIDFTTRKYRKIGLGVMGWADMLCLLGIPYNSSEALDLIDKIGAMIQNEAKLASIDLAIERGSFPGIDETIYKGSTMRNATVTTIAPTGTLSIIASVSSGIEPLFALAFFRNVMDNDELDYVNWMFEQAFVTATHHEKGSEVYNRTMKLVAQKGTVHGNPDVPLALQNLFVTAHDVDVEWHILHQGYWQKYTDNAVSKTINMKPEATKEEVLQAYILARKHCKGVTIYRDGSRDNQVFNIGTSKNKEEKAPEIKVEIQPVIEHVAPKPRPRPEITTGFTQKVKIGCGNLYVTVNYDDKGVCEVFTNTGRAGGCPSQSEATSRLVSLALRSGIDTKAIVEQLKGIRCPSTIRQKGLKVLSCPDAIGQMIEKVANLHNGTLTSIIPSLENDQHNAVEEVDNTCTGDCAGCTMKDFCNAPKGEDKGKLTTHCPECGKPVEHEGGCVICRRCGFSKCG